VDLTPEAVDKIGYAVYERWRAMPNRDAYVATMMATAARDGYRAGREDAVPATCQENALPERFGAFVDAHLHECSREAEHHSLVHRCACGTEWWLTDGQGNQPRTASQGDGDNPEEQRPTLDQERSEERP